MKRALLIAFHYPPAAGSSGIQRTLSFSKYLSENGWKPTVLTAHTRAYSRCSNDQMGDVPPDVRVIRAFALDASRHLAFRGRYPRALAYPDRWVSWFLGGVASALRLVRQERPDVLWSTYPIATAHLIGYAVHRLTAIPWIADFRDSMTEEDYPTDARTRKIYRWIERKTVMAAASCVFTAPGTVRMYTDRYPDVDSSRWKCIANGFDEQAFANCEALGSGESCVGGKIVLLHSGILYPSERDPTAFFAAVRQLLDDRSSGFENVEIRLRASGFDRELEAQVVSRGIESVVKILPAVSYAEALSEMMQADGLLIFQASNCNHQIPAKVYEYLRARRPILAVADPAGDTASLLRLNGTSNIARLDSQEQIATALRNFLHEISQGSVTIADEAAVSGYSRRKQTGKLAELFAQVAG